MIEYKVRALETGGTADLAKACNDAAQDGWRFASAGGMTVRVYLFFERGGVQR